MALSPDTRMLGARAAAGPCGARHPSLVRAGNRAARNTTFLVVIAWLTGALGTEVEAQAPDRTMRPALGPMPRVNLPDAQRFALDHGLEIVLVEKREVPLVQINVQIRAGAAFDPQQSPGLASLTADMLDEGAGGRSALDLADAFEQLGARFNINAGRHIATMSLRVPVARLDDALALARTVILQPDFPAEELQRKRDERLTALIRRHDEPNAIAEVLFQEVVFGKDHPYGRSAIGNEAFLRTVTPDHLREFHSRHYVANNASVIVVGAVDATAVRATIERAFGE